MSNWFEEYPYAVDKDNINLPRHLRPKPEDVAADHSVSCGRIADISKRKERRVAGARLAKKRAFNRVYRNRSNLKTLEVRIQRLKAEIQNLEKTMMDRDAQLRCMSLRVELHKTKINYGRIKRFLDNVDVKALGEKWDRLIKEDEKKLKKEL